MTDPSDWYRPARRYGAAAVAWAEVAGRDAWHHGPGLLNALADFTNCVMADAATRHLPLTERLHRTLPAVMRAYVDRHLAAMGAAPLAEQDIEDARAETVPTKDIAWADIEAARRDPEANP